MKIFSFLFLNFVYLARNEVVGNFIPSLIRMWNKLPYQDDLKLFEGNETNLYFFVIDDITSTL